MRPPRQNGEMEQGGGAFFAAPPSLSSPVDAKTLSGVTPREEEEEEGQIEALTGGQMLEPDGRSQKS